MSDEPRPLAGEWLHPPAGHHSYPPRRPRFPGPRQECPHCGLASETTSKTCPVCEARFEPRWTRRALARVRALIT